MKLAWRKPSCRAELSLQRMAPLIVGKNPDLCHPIHSRRQAAMYRRMMLRHGTFIADENRRLPKVVKR